MVYTRKMFVGRIQFISVFLILSFYQLFAAGTTTAEFLTFSPDARSSAMGNTGVAVFDDSDNFSYNPAILGAASRNEFNLSTMKLNGFEDGLGGSSLANSKYLMKTDYTPRGFGPFAGYGNWGFDMTYASYGEIPVTKDTPDAIGSFTAWNLAMAVAWGNRVERHPIAQNIPFGISLKYIHQSLGDASSMGVATDLGFAYVMPKSSSMSGFTFGMSILNLGFASAFVSESDPMPLTFKAGVGYRFFMSKIVHALGGPKKVFKTFSEDGVFALEVTKLSGHSFALGTGLELTFLDMVTVRTGYEFLETERGITLGMGFQFKKGGTHHKLDFAWVPQRLLGDNFRLTYRYVWGSTGGVKNQRLRQVIQFRNQEKDIENPFDLEDDVLENQKNPKKNKKKDNKKKRRRGL